MLRGLLLLGLGACVRAPAAPPAAAPAAVAIGSTWTAPGDEVIRFARAQIGKPYCWGGAGPGCFDCSGLVEKAWRRVGVRLPRTSTDMARELVEIPLLEARAGDVLYWPGHVGLYVGPGEVIDAGRSHHFVSARRVWGVPRVLRPTGT